MLDLDEVGSTGGRLAFDGSFNIDEADDMLDPVVVVIGAEEERGGGKDEEAIDAGGGTVGNDASCFLSTEIAVNNREPWMS